MLCFIRCDYTKYKRTITQTHMVLITTEREYCPCARDYSGLYRSGSAAVEMSGSTSRHSNRGMYCNVRYYLSRCAGLIVSV